MDPRRGLGGSLRPVGSSPVAPGLRSLGEQVAAVERQAIAAALRDARGNRALAARQLGMSRAARYDRLARWPELLASG